MGHVAFTQQVDFTGFRPSSLLSFYDNIRSQVEAERYLKHR
jgi:hypothetical protein